MHDTTGTPTRMEESPSAARQEKASLSPSKYPERLVDDSRTSVREKGIWVDDKSAINEELMALIPTKILKMRTTFELVIDLNFEGQVGFICLQKNERNEPQSCVAVSALHNIAEVKDQPKAAYVRSSALFPEFNVGLNFPEAGVKLSSIAPYELSPSQELSIPWKHGIDIAWSSKVFTVAMRSDIVESSFERVRGGFECKVGQKIGIGVYSDTGATRKTIGNPDVVEEELLRIYGPPKTMHIYTGKITKPNDSGVTRDDVGKAIAVHAGAHPRKIKNFGFKFTAKPPPN